MSSFGKLLAQLGEVLGWSPEVSVIQLPAKVEPVDEVHPCPLCGRRCDFSVCRCEEGCPGDGDHLRRLRRGHVT